MRVMLSGLGLRSWRPRRDSKSGEILESGPPKNMTARDVTGFFVFSPPGNRAIFPSFWGDFLTKLHRKPGESNGENSEKSSGDGAPKSQISVPCRSRKRPDKKDMTAKLLEKQVRQGIVDRQQEKLPWRPKSSTSFSAEMLCEHTPRRSETSLGCCRPARGSLTTIFTWQT